MTAFERGNYTMGEVFRKADKQSNIAIISQCNHDAEALSFNAFQLIQKGNTIIYV